MSLGFQGYTGLSCDNNRRYACSTTALRVRCIYVRVRHKQCMERAHQRAAMDGLRGRNDVSVYSWKSLEEYGIVAWLVAAWLVHATPACHD